MKEFNLSYLYKVIRERQKEGDAQSYVCALLEKGNEKVLKKVQEECFEVLYAAQSQDKHCLTEELCDLFFHLLLMMAHYNIELDEVTQVLQKRHQQLQKR